MVCQRKITGTHCWILTARMFNICACYSFRKKLSFVQRLCDLQKGRINVEREKNKKAKTHALTAAVTGEMLNLHLHQGRAYIRYVCIELINHPMFKSDLVIRLACLDYAVLFTLPKDQAAGCYSHLFHSCCVRDCLAKELKIVHMDDLYIWSSCTLVQRWKIWSRF